MDWETYSVRIDSMSNSSFLPKNIAPILEPEVTDIPDKSEVTPVTEVPLILSETSVTEHNVNPEPSQYYSSRSVSITRPISSPQDQIPPSHLLY